MNIFDEVVRRVRKELRGGDASQVKIDASSTLEDLGLSSLQVAEIVFGLEEDLNLELDEERAANIKTLGELVQLANESLGHELPEHVTGAAGA